MRAFDRSRVPVEYRNLPLLDQMEAESIAQLKDPNYRWAIATHEAAHGVYRLRAGATKLIYVGPYFFYDIEAKTVQKVVAGISSEWGSLTHLDFKNVARYCGAGWIWEKEVCPYSTDAEASADRDRAVFDADVHRVHPDATNEEIQMYWGRAEAEVKADLQNLEIRSQIEKLALDFKKFLED